MTKVYKVYEVTFVETRTHTVRVRASSKGEAREKGQEAFDERDYDAEFDDAPGPSEYAVKSVTVSKDQKGDVDAEVDDGEG